MTMKLRVLRMFTRKYGVVKGATVCNRVMLDSWHKYYCDSAEKTDCYQTRQIRSCCCISDRRHQFCQLIYRTPRSLWVSIDLSIYTQIYHMISYHVIHTQICKYLSARYRYLGLWPAASFQSGIGGNG